MIAYDHDSKPIEERRTDSRGRYRFSVSQPVSRVQSIVQGRRTTVSGPWKENATVDIQLRAGY